MDTASIFAGTVCVSTLSPSFICRMPPADSESVVITGSMSERDIGTLTDVVQTEVEKQLVNISEFGYYILVITVYNH